MIVRLIIEKNNPHVLSKTQEILTEHKKSLCDISQPSPKIKWEAKSEKGYNIFSCSLTLSGKDCGVILQKKHRRREFHSDDYPNHYDVIRLDDSKLVFITCHSEQKAGERIAGYTITRTFNTSDFALVFYNIKKKKLEKSLKLGTYCMAGDGWSSPRGKSASYGLIPIENCSTQFIIAKDKDVWDGSHGFSQSSKFFIYDILANKKQKYKYPINITKAAMSNCKQYIVIISSMLDWNYSNHLIVLKNGVKEPLIRLSSLSGDIEFAFAPDGSLFVIADNNIQKIDLKINPANLTSIDRHIYSGNLHSCYFDENGMFVVNEGLHGKGTLLTRYQIACLEDYRKQRHAKICSELHSYRGIGATLFATPVRRIVADYCEGEVDKLAPTIGPR